MRVELRRVEGGGAGAPVVAGHAPPAAGVEARAEDAGGQRAVGQGGHAVRGAKRQQLLFRAALQQMVGQLQRAHRARPVQARQLAALQVADPAGAYLALLLQAPDRLPGGVEVAVRAGPVDLVEVEVVGTQPPQARFGLAQHAGAGQAGIGAPAAGAPQEAALAGQPHLPAQAVGAQRAPHQRLGVPHAVHRSGVDPVDAQLHRPHDGGRGERVVLPPPGVAPSGAAHGPGPQAEPRPAAQGRRGAAGRGQRFFQARGAAASSAARAARSASAEKRGRSAPRRAARATAASLPTSTTRRLPRVTAV